MRWLSAAQSPIHMLFVVMEVTNVSPTNTAPSGGGSVTILGINFGATNLTASTTVNEMDMCRTTSWISYSMLMCAVPVTVTHHEPATEGPSMAMAGLVVKDDGIRFTLDGASPVELSHELSLTEDNMIACNLNPTSGYIMFCLQHRLLALYLH